MSDPGLALQKALLDKLSASLTVRVFDAVPAKTPYPYGTLDYEVSNNASPITGRKRESRLFYLSVWSNHKGQSEVKRINSEIAAVLDRVELPLGAGRAVLVSVLRTETSREPDGVTFMGGVTLRILTQH